MSQVIIAGDTSGTITLQAPAVSGSTTLTLPAATGTVMVSGNMPAFSAYLGTSQNTTSGVATKIQFNTEEFDTNSYYDNATNYRFTPLIAGYYQVSSAYTTNTAAITRANISIYKNGSSFKAGGDYASYTGIGTLTVSALIYLNGSTDYIEIYALQTGTSPQVFAGVGSTYFQAVLVRT
jgi:hypothetical protein